PDRRGTHRTPVALRAVSVGYARGGAPVHALGDQLEDLLRLGAVAPPPIGDEPLREDMSQRVGLDALVRVEHVPDADRHRRVVRPPPGTLRQLARLDARGHRCGWPEEPLTERVADREPLERQAETGHALAVRAHASDARLNSARLTSRPA